MQPDRFKSPKLPDSRIHELKPAELRITAFISRDSSVALPGTPMTEKESDYFVHESSYVDDGAQVGPGSTIWHFCHIMPGVSIGRDCRIGQNVVIGPNCAVGNNVKIQNKYLLIMASFIFLVIFSMSVTAGSLKFSNNVKENQYKNEEAKMYVSFN